LVDVLPDHNSFRAAVVENKREFMRRMGPYLSLPEHHQPLLCTHVTCNISSLDLRAILYQSRNNRGGSVVCHLGEVHLGSSAHGEILDLLEIS